jgi:hypothetical protein
MAIKAAWVEHFPWLRGKARDTLFKHAGMSKWTQAGKFERA